MVPKINVTPTQSISIHNLNNLLATLCMQTHAPPVNYARTQHLNSGSLRVAGLKSSLRPFQKGNNLPGPALYWFILSQGYGSTIQEAAEELAWCSGRPVSL